MLSLLYDHGCSVGLCGLRPKTEVDPLGVPLEHGGPRHKVTVVPMKPEPREKGTQDATKKSFLRENSLTFATPRRPNGTRMELANYDGFPDQEDSPSDNGYSSDSSAFDKEIGRCHEELLKVTKMERRLMQQESQRAAMKCSELGAPAPRRQETSQLEDRLLKMQHIHLPKRETKAKNASRTDAAGPAGPSDDSEESDGDQDDEMTVDRRYKHLDIQRRMQYLRKVMDGGNFGIPKQKNAEGGFDKHPEYQHTVDDYQATMRAKLVRLEGRAPVFEQTSDPASAVRDAVAKYHGTAVRLGVMFPEPNSENVAGLSSEELCRLQRWRLDLKPGGDCSFVLAGTRSCSSVETDESPKLKVNLSQSSSVHSLQQRETKEFSRYEHLGSSWGATLRRSFSSKGV